MAIITIPPFFISNSNWMRSFIASQFMLFHNAINHRIPYPTLFNSKRKWSPRGLSLTVWIDEVILLYSPVFVTTYVVHFLSKAPPHVLFHNACEQWDTSSFIWKKHRSDRLVRIRIYDGLSLTIFIFISEMFTPPYLRWYLPYMSVTACRSTKSAFCIIP